MPNPSAKSFKLKFLIRLTLMFACFLSSAHASTDSTNIGISITVQNPCRLSIGGQLNESTNRCQLSESEFAKKVLKKINQQKLIKERQQIVTQDDGSLSIRVSITAP